MSATDNTSGLPLETSSVRLLRRNKPVICIDASRAMPRCFDRNELQQGTTVEDLRAADVECLIVTGDNPECGYHVACCAGFLDPGVQVLFGEATASNTPDETKETRITHHSPVLDESVPVLLGEATVSDSADEMQDSRSTHEGTQHDADRCEVSWTRIGTERLHGYGPLLTTRELLGMIDADVDGKEQGKMNYALVITGSAWDILRRDGSGLGSSLRSPEGDIGGTEAFQRLLSHVKVAARFSPVQKEDIVRALADKGRTVAMVGDGGNDCAALRAAHVGLALNGAEASMVSPFSSKQRSIVAVMDLLLEGRCALTTSFANYKFLILQGLTLATAAVRPVELSAQSRCVAFSWVVRH